MVLTQGDGDGRLRLPAAGLRPLKRTDCWHDDGSA